MWWYYVLDASERSMHCFGMKHNNTAPRGRRVSSTSVIPQIALHAREIRLEALPQQGECEQKKPPGRSGIIGCVYSESAETKGLGGTARSYNVNPCFYVPNNRPTMGLYKKWCSAGPCQ